MNLLFPPQCAYCLADIAEAEDRILLCPECRRRMVPEKWIGCRHCGGIILEEIQTADYCSMCKNPPLLFDTVVTLGGYRDLSNAVLRMKKKRHESLAVAMGRMLAEKRFDELAALHADVIMPIPMYWARRMRRGTSSPEMLARCLGERLNIPVQSRVLVRSRDTKPQIALPPKQRFRNVRGAFRVKPGRTFDGARVLLVDDVLTTGATGSEAAKVLKQAGAAMVAVAVLARAQGSESHP